MTGGRRAATPLPSIDRDVAATAALALYSLAVGVGFARVFSGWAFLPHFLLLVIVGHGSSLAMRRARVSGWISVPAMTLLMVWTVALYKYRATLTWLVPGRATWDQLQLDISVVRDQFQTAVAPVIYEVGWATLAGMAMVIVIAMADAFAFKAEARGEALVPGGVLFIFIAALSRDRMRLSSAVLLVGAGILAVIALRNLHDRSRQVELTANRGRRSITWPAAVGAAVAIAVLAGVIGPRIPGAEADPLYQTRGRGGGITSVGNPLVDIRSRLVNHGDFELFRMNSDTERYWRLTTLPEFDGRTFKLPSRSLDRVDDTGDTPQGRTIRQRIQILALTDKIVPAAASVYQVDPNEEMRVNYDTGTLLKLSDLQSGEQYTIVSVAPDLTPDELRAASTDNPPDEIFLDLPGNVPDDVYDIAAEVTAGATTSYDKLIALQDWFRNNFEYSTEVQSGHGTNAIENFLQIRKGYCEQFAATFAVMARTLGIPSRVAVGFTPGRLRSDGWYSVLGRNSHAWPEIWFDGIGWVDFEPTPSRGIPGAEAYTGVPAAQDEAVPNTPAAEPGAVTLPPTPTTVFSPPTTVRQRTPDAVGDPDSRTPPLPSGNAPPASTDDGGSSLPWLLLAIPVIVLVALAFPAVARRWNRRKARQQGTQQRVSLAWQHACRAASRAGVDGSPAMTSREWANATAHKLPVAARPMASLAAVVDRVSYSPPDSIEPHRANTFGRDCELWSDQVSRIATDTLTSSERMRQYFRDLN